MELYTDGSCLKNPGDGGFCGYGIHNDKVIFKTCGCESKTTNNIMEMKAVIHGIKKANVNGWIEYTIYTDSQYVMNGITKWIKGWQKKGWKTATGSDVKNKELWIEMNKLMTPGIHFKWVKAHNGNKWNEKVDTVARECARLIENKDNILEYI